MKTNNITYRRVGDYNIPNLVLSPKESSITIGKWAMLHKTYLEKYKEVLFNSLLIQGNLYQHCAEAEKQAREMFELLIEQMKVVEGVTEQMKEKNQIEWVQRMGNIEARAREIVNNEIILK